VDLFRTDSRNPVAISHDFRVAARSRTDLAKYSIDRNAGSSLGCLDGEGGIDLAGLRRIPSGFLRVIFRGVL
jgi:hypothetical protein